MVSKISATKGIEEYWKISKMHYNALIKKGFEHFQYDQSGLSKHTRLESLIDYNFLSATPNIKSQRISIGLNITVAGIINLELGYSSFLGFWRRVSQILSEI